MGLSILFSPQPDENTGTSAAFEYAKRASTILSNSNIDDHDERKNKKNHNIEIQRLSIDSLNSWAEEVVDNSHSNNLLEDIAHHESSSSERNHTLVIISCSADGSVDRVVRKILRSLKNTTTSENKKKKAIVLGNESHLLMKSGGSLTSMNNETAEKVEAKKLGIALLGHARCDNSANQMKDTIFNYGRKFHKCFLSLLASNSSSGKGNTSSYIQKIEVQAELDGPDVSGGFDDWLKSTFLE